MRLLAVCVVLWCCLQCAVCQCENFEVTGGQLFVCRLTAAEFFDDIDAGSAISVEFRASLEGHVGLPEWLSLYQPSLSSSASLYGAPPIGMDGVVVILIQAQRRDTFETRVHTLTFLTEPPEGSSAYIAQFYVTNLNTDEFLTPSNLQLFTSTLVAVFENNDSYITGIQNPAVLNVPIPPPPNKHGVVVMATPGMDVEVVMASDVETASVQENCSDVINPPKNFDLFRQNGYIIDWCQYQVQLSVFETDAIVEGGGGEEEVVDVPSGRRGSVALVVVIVVCVVVIVVLLVGMGCVMFGGRRQSYIKKDTPKLTLLHVTQNEVRRPAAVQVALRDLARLPRRRPAVGQGGVVSSKVEEEEDVLLPPPTLPAESAPPNPPPAYHFPQMLLQQPSTEQ